MKALRTRHEEIVTAEKLAKTKQDTNKAKQTVAAVAIDVISVFCACHAPAVRGSWMDALLEALCIQMCLKSTHAS
jgi:maleate cis-trans isomerase